VQETGNGPTMRRPKSNKKAKRSNQPRGNGSYSGRSYSAKPRHQSSEEYEEIVDEEFRPAWTDRFLTRRKRSRSKR